MTKNHEGLGQGQETRRDLEDLRQYLEREYIDALVEARQKIVANERSSIL